MVEARDVKIKRLAMRSMRRGIKEMDLILSAYANAHLADLDDANLGLYDDLLSENDHDLYAWVTGHADTPTRYIDMMNVVRAGATGLTKPNV